MSRRITVKAIRGFDGSGGRKVKINETYECHPTVGNALISSRRAVLYVEPAANVHGPKETKPRAPEEVKKREPETVDLEELPAKQAASFVGSLDDLRELERYRTAEIAGKGRKTVLDAIKNAVAKLEA